MNRITTYFAVCFSLFINASCSAQKNLPVISINAYYTIPTGGTIQVDGEGREMSPRRDTIFNLYAEAKDKKIEWLRAWANGASYSVIPISYTTLKTDIGKKFSDEQPIEIIPKEGNGLQQLELSNDGEQKKPPQSLQYNEVLLQYKWKDKPYYVKTGKAIQLASPEYQ